MFELSIIIPSRNEMFLENTINSILANIELNTEIIVICDGQWPVFPIKDHPKVTMIHHSKSIGQREATNEAVRLSQSKYIMKCDAHCAFARGFDRILLEDMKDNLTMVPLMKNLHAFDWVCKKCGSRRYQGPTPTNCSNCENTLEFERDIIWQPKQSPNSTSYCFDSEPHFQYFGAFKKRPEGQGDITETMSLQGSCWLVTREKYIELNLCDSNTFGSWGSQGIEVAVKTWLSGGKVVCNHKTWYAHMFRTQGGDFGFPYPLSGKQVQIAKNKIKEIFFNNAWEKQKLPLSWLIEKFSPIPGWAKDDLEKIKKVTLNHCDKVCGNKSIIFYTDNQLKLKIAHMVQKNLKTISLPIVTASLKPMPHFGSKNIVMKEKRSYLTMFKQILAALEISDAKYIFFTEHDVLYHKSHFDFIPDRDDIIYYNENLYNFNCKTGKFVFYYAKRTSQLCACKELLIEHYKKRIEIIEKNGFTIKMGFEPGTHVRKERVDDLKSSIWLSEFPNVDIRHGKNLTKSKLSLEDFKNKPKIFKEFNSIPYWGDLKDLKGAV